MLRLLRNAAFASRRVLLTGAGADRIGIITDVTGAIFAEGGNIRESCMTKLAGEFALMMLLEVPVERIASLQLKLYKNLSDLNLSIRDVNEASSTLNPETYPVRMVISGRDHPGIMHHFSNFLAFSGISVSSLSTQYAPDSEEHLQWLKLKTRVRVPKLINFEDLQQKIKTLAAQDGVEVTLTKLLPSEDLD